MATFDVSAHSLLLAPNSILDQKSPDASPSENTLSQIGHRLTLVHEWGIPPGARILEIGCGQGDCTIVLADAVGETGHVDALDPAPGDYGSPTTLHDAQTHILSGPLGPRINFYNLTKPTDFISNLPPTTSGYDYVVLTHSLWYFNNRTQDLVDLLTHLRSSPSALKPSTKLLIAEWSLRATSLTNLPHLHAAIFWATLESARLEPSSQNIRNVMTPKAIREAVEGTQDWSLIRQAMVPTKPGVRDGYWEVNGAVCDGRADVDTVFAERDGPDRIKGKLERLLEDTLDALDQSLEAIPGAGGLNFVTSMDVWMSKFEFLGK